jgi:vancomycin permeability regulator SanA
MMEKNMIAAGTISRTVAGFLGGLTALNLAFRFGGSADMNLWWIDLRGWPSWMAGCLLMAAAGLWCALAIRGRCRPWRRWVTLAVTAVTMLIVLGNARTVLRLYHAGTVGGGFILPFSLFVLVAVSLIAVGLIWPARAGKEEYRKLLGATVLGGLIVLLPLGQMLCYGMTDYRRPADAAVILGAGVYADGRVSDALSDRLATGVELYTQGLVPKLIMSGGPGMGDIHETTAMRQWAIDHGVPPEAILVDLDGLNTTHTAKNVAAMLPENRLLAVSHAYHLPRVKLAFQAEDVTVFTVPCHESYTLRAMPKYILREIVAIWMYYLL